MKQSFLVKPFFVALLLTSALAVARFFVSFDAIERFETEQLVQKFASRTREGAALDFPKDIVLVEINEQSTHLQRRWPWNLSEIAALIRNLREGNPRAIAFELPLLLEQDRSLRSKIGELTEAFEKHFPPPAKEAAPEPKKGKRPPRKSKAELDREKAEQTRNQDLRKKIVELKVDPFEEIYKEIKATKQLVFGWRYYRTEPDIPGLDIPYLQEKKKQLEEAKTPPKDAKTPLPLPPALFSLAAPAYVFGAPPGDPALDIAALRDNPKITPLTRFHGFVNLTDNPSKVLLDVPLFVRNQGKTYPSLALATYIASKNGDVPNRNVGPRGYVSLSLQNQEFPLLKDGRMQLNYFGPAGLIKNRLIAGDIVKKMNFSVDDLKDKIVLVGLTSNEISTKIRSPYERPFSHLEVQAMLLANLLKTRPIVRGVIWVEIGVLLVCGLLLGLFLSKLGMFGGFVIAAVMALLISFLDRQFLFSTSEWYRFADIQIGLFLLVFLVSVIRSATSDKMIREIRERFEPRVHPEQVKALLSRPALVPTKGERRPISFVSASAVPVGSALRETDDPARIAALFHHLMSPLADAFIQSKGTLQHLSGHQTQGFFNAPFALPDHVEKACLAALQIKFAWDDFVHKYWLQEELPAPQLSIGVDTGLAIVGNLGGDKRYVFSAIGAPAEGSETLQQICRVYSSPILVSEAVAALFRETRAFLVREIDRVKLEEGQAAFPIYELLAQGGGSSPLSEAAQWYQDGLSYYRSRNFQEALRLFQQILHVRQDDGPAQVMAKRCQQYINYPPSFQWDGSFKLRT